MNSMFGRFGAIDLDDLIDNLSLDDAERIIREYRRRLGCIIVFTLFLSGIFVLCCELGIF